MPTYRYQPLPHDQRRLLQLFYRRHGSTMRVSGEASLWVARAEEIVAGLNLTAVAEGHWLTGLFVAPAQRRRGIAAGLIDAALTASRGPTWLFCAPALEEFYQALGFSTQVALPPALLGRLQRYQRSKALIALQHDA